MNDGEFEALVRNEVVSKDWIIRLAQREWERDGKPNGEEYRNSKWGRMKIKEIHWRQAMESAEGYYSHSAGDDW